MVITVLFQYIITIIQNDDIKLRRWTLRNNLPHVRNSYANNVDENCKNYILANNRLLMNCYSYN